MSDKSQIDKNLTGISESYHRAKRSYGFISALLISWELIGINLGAKPFKYYDFSINNPEAVPYAIIVLILYFAFRTTVEWLQCGINRRNLRPAYFDFWIAHCIGILAIGLFIFQKALNLQIANYFPKFFSKTQLAGVTSFLLVIGLNYVIRYVRKKPLQNFYWIPRIFIIVVTLLSALYLFSVIRTFTDENYFALIFGLVIGLIMLFIYYKTIEKSTENGLGEEVKTIIFCTEAEEKISNEQTISEIDLSLKNLFDEGNKYLFSGQYAAAATQYEKVVNKDSKLANAYINLGVAYLGIWSLNPRDEFLERSIAASRKALENYPEGCRSRLNLAVALSKNQKTEHEALKYLNEADERGDYRNPFTWAKIKLFKAAMILTLSQRPNREDYRKMLPDASFSVSESLRLFEMTETEKLTPTLIRDAHAIKDSINIALEVLK